MFHEDVAKPFTEYPMPSKFQELMKRLELKGYRLKKYKKLVDELQIISSGRTPEKIHEDDDMPTYKRYLGKLKEIEGFVKRGEIAIDWIQFRNSKFDTILNNFASGQELNDDDLEYIYFSTFSERKAAFINQRSIKKDVSRLLECDESEVAFSLEEALLFKTKFYFGNLELDETYIHNRKNVEFPMNIYRRFLFVVSSDRTDWDNVKKVVFPLSVGDDFFISNAKIDNMTLPRIVNGDCTIDGTASIHNAVMPKVINGSLTFNFVDEMSGVVMPEYIGLVLDLRSFYDPQQLLNIDLSKTFVEGSIKIQSIPDEDFQALKDKYPHLKVKFIMME